MRLICTAATGRCGEQSLSAFLRHHLPDALVLWEEPQIHPLLPSRLGDVEKRLRRRFVETHELLGRGRVLTAFDAGDDAALDAMARKRLAWLERQAAAAGASVCIDVSKFFIRGLHRPLTRLRPNMALIRLVRDPILNMRSYLNRDKDFALDNNDPASPRNELPMDSAIGPAERYLWSWCEVYLRFDSLVREFGLGPAVEIRTEDLNDAAAMARHLIALDLPPQIPVTALPPRN
ncbi:MAG: hypothetical protein HOH66_00390, partial [Rhodospirillaceae bacterium]|nr:hypothetical protein [Rhodospirillaceae bacterium]